MAFQAFSPNKRTMLQSQDEEKQGRRTFATDQIAAATWQYLEREISVDQFGESIDKLGDFVDLLDDKR